MAIISFENLAPDGEFAEVPDGFRRLNWDHFIAIDANYFDNRGGGIATNAIHTGEAAGYSAGGRVLSFESPNRDDDFDLNNGYFTAVVGTGGTNEATVKVFGFDDGERVAKKVLTLDTNDREFVRFGPQFDDIDEVRFTLKGGDFGLGIDDLFIDF